MASKEWLMLDFMIPKEPSRVRVSVWRKLKKTGSVPLGQSLWVLPDSTEHLDVLTAISDEIRANKGEAYVLRATLTDPEREVNVRNLFNDARNGEYKEFLEDCADLIEDVGKRLKKRKFKESKVEKFQRELEKITEHFARIESRDFFGAPSQARARGEVEACTALYDRYCTEVSKHESVQKT